MKGIPVSIPVPPAAMELLERLGQGGFSAYVVGGCVRDQIMGCAPNDWDIATSALPEQAVRCFGGLRVLETGLAHGTITVWIGDTPYEVTTFRRDGPYTDHRRPDRVDFVTSLEEDLARRDFTINAMAYHPDEGLVDVFGGQKDILHRRITCVGEPSQRFEEDALRILRGVRFASQLDFEVDGKTAKAMEQCAALLQEIAVERLATELNKAITGSGAYRCFREHFRVIAQVLPELFGNESLWDNRQPPASWNRAVLAMHHAPVSVSVRLAALFCGSVKLLYFTEKNTISNKATEVIAATAQAALERLRYDNRTRSQVVEMIRLLPQALLPTKESIARWLGQVGQDGLRRQIALRRALSAADKLDTTRLSEIEEVMNQLLGEDICYRVDQLAIRGGDLLEAGVPPGTAVGQCLQALLDSVIAGRVPNEWNALLSEAIAFTAHRDGGMEKE